MPTRGRALMARRAVDLWQAQTYPDRELVIVDDRDNPSFARGISAPGIQYFELPRRLLVGAKRNVACSRALGEIICHWDDDDYSAPGRIADQVARLVKFEKAVTGYNSMDFVRGEERWHYAGAANYALGTSLMYRRSWWEQHPFQDLREGEDNGMVAAARDHNQIVSVPANGLMYATVHPGSTSTADLSKLPFRKVS